MDNVTLLPIVAAAVATTIIGMIWYHPRVLGGIWARLVGVTPEMVERGKKRMIPYTITAFIGSMLIAYVMDYFGIAWAVYDPAGALQLGFWCWAGFVAPTMLGTVLWEQKSFKLYLINALYWLVAFCVIALVLLY